MTNNRFKRLNRRLNRIECKCDIIIAEIRLKRNRLQQSDIDITIDKLHNAAKRMRQQCRLEKEAVRRLTEMKSRE